MQSSSQQNLIAFLNESQVQPRKTKSMFFRNQYKKKKEKYKPIVVNTPESPKNTSVLTLLKREYNNNKRSQKDSMISITDSYVSEISTASMESHMVNNMRLPSYPELMSANERRNIQLFNQPDKDIDEDLENALDENSSTSSTSLEEDVPLQQVRKLNTKKSVQFTGVDIINHVKKTDSAELIAFKDKIQLFEGKSKLDSIEEEDEVKEDWIVSRTTQTESNLIHSNVEGLSMEEVKEQLVLLMKENKESKSRMHALVDENSSHVEQNNTLKMNLEQVCSERDLLTKECSTIQLDYNSIKSKSAELKKLLSQNQKKNKELEKLSKKAVSKIKELESERKFLNMQIEWLRSKMVDDVDYDDEKLESSSYCSSVMSPIETKMKRKNKKKSEEDDGWETEV